MQNRPKTVALLTATAALTVAFAILFAPQFTRSIAARDVQKVSEVQKISDVQKISERVPQAAPAVTLDTTRIAPADVLGTGVVSWSPLTGDGSN